MSRPVKVAAILLWFYGALLLIEAVVLGVVHAWSGKGSLESFAIHVLGAFGFAVLGFALLRGRRWAWWAAVSVAGVLGLLGLAGLLLISFGPSQRLMSGFEENYQLGNLGFLLFPLSVAVLGGSFSALVKKEARDVFFPKVGPSR